MAERPSNPKPDQVLEKLKDLPTVGTLTQDNSGMIYLNLDDNWVFKALDILRDFGYIRPPFFVYPPTPIGAHIKIITKREAEDYELFEESREIPHLGEEFEFKVMKAFVSYPRTNKFGLDTRYKLKVEVTPELLKIRRGLTGKTTPPRNGFFIVVGVRNLEIMEDLTHPTFDEVEYESKMNLKKKQKNIEKEDEEDFDLKKDKGSKK